MFDPAFFDDRAPLAVFLFQQGMRPRPDAIETVARASGFTLVASTQQPADPKSLQCIEVLRNGLTFDLAGLSPGRPARYPAIPHRHDLPSDLDLARLEGMTLLPGPHLAGGQRTVPSIRVTAALLTELARCPGLVGLSWVPSGAFVSPRWFTQSVTDWMAGGLFPALSLVSLLRQPCGSIISQGLQFIAGRDFRLEFTASPNSPTKRQNLRHAARLADWLVRQDQFDIVDTAAVPGVGVVRFSLNQNGTLVALL